MNKSDTLIISEFVGNLYRVSSIINLYSLQTKRFSKQKITKQYSKYLFKITNSFVKLYQGDTGLKLEIVVKQVEELEDILPILETLKTSVSNLKPLINSPLVTILDDIYLKTCTTIYKLRND